MIINRIVKNELDGSISAVLHLSEEQVKFLINFAIAFLVDRGTLQIYDIKEEDTKTEEGKLTSDFLASVDPSKIGQA